MNYIELKAPAKINIGLRVLSKRKDGFHNLETIFYPLNSLHDNLKIEKSSSIKLTSNVQEINYNDNLIIRAVKLAEGFLNRNLPVKIELQKNIPIGAGLGGGSSDAAATLIALNKIFELELNNDQLSNLALQLGSDVPFFIKPEPCIGRSRGELFEPVTIQIPFPILLINPGIHVSTKKAFENIILKSNRTGISEFLADVKNDQNAWKDYLQNDFEEYIFSKYTEIKNIRDKMYKMGSIFSMMTGTGSTVFGFFKDIVSAQKAQNNFPSNYFKFISYP